MKYIELLIDTIGDILIEALVMLLMILAKFSSGDTQIIIILGFMLIRLTIRSMHMRYEHGNELLCSKK